MSLRRERGVIGYALLAIHAPMFNLDSPLCLTLPSCFHHFPAQIEIPDGDEGVMKLARYTDKMVTTLLLVRKSKYSGDLPKFACGY
jgi:hypothetical protein